METAIYCDDVQKVFNFYQNIFDFPVVQKSLPRSVFLRCGESILLIFNRSMTSQEGQLPPPHGATGSQHFSFEIPDNEYGDWEKLFSEKGIPIEKEVSWD